MYGRWAAFEVVVCPDQTHPILEVDDCSSELQEHVGSVDREPVDEVDLAL